MNVGPSDIIQGILLLTWIWDNGFVRENSRDVRYENFRSDVADFDSVLRDLESTLASAEQRYRQRGATSALNPRDASFEHERRRLVGAFNVTLDECKTVLSRNKIKPQTNAQGVLQSLIWAAGVENKVNELRGRLQFHTQKMLLVVNRLSLRFMTDSADMLEDILGLTEQSFTLQRRTQAILEDTYALLAAHVQGRGPASIAPRPAEPSPIPIVLAQRFDTMLSVFAPSAFSQAGCDVRELPLGEAFDALMIHFAGSADAATGSQTPEHHVQLLKAIWLVNQLQASQDYQNARPGYYYRRAINQIEQQLLARMRDPRLVPFDIDMLAALSDEIYQIWPSPEPVNSISQADAKPGELEEVRLDLVLQGDFTQQRVVVFRRSEHQFRIVQEFVREANGRSEQQQVTLYFDMNQDHFIPWYSLPRSSQSSHEAAISNQATGDLESYRFRSSGDLFRFQEVFLGQRLVFEDTRVSFKLSDGTEGIGRFQIWQEPVTSRPAMNDFGNSSSSSASPTSLRSSRVGSYAGSVAPSTIFEHAEGTEGGSIPMPALVILTELQGKVAYLYVKLEQGLRVFHEHCECRLGPAGYARCKVLSLARERLRKFPILVKYANFDDQGHIFSSCDLSVFRVPTHPRRKEMKPRMVDNILMTFQTPTAKDAFNLELHQRFDLRDLMIQQHNHYDHTMLYSAERPEKVRETRAPSMNPLSRTPSFAPTIGSLQFGENFTDEIARSTDPVVQRNRAGSNNAAATIPSLMRTATELPVRPASQQIRRSTTSRPDTYHSNRTSRGFRDSLRRLAG